MTASARSATSNLIDSTLSAPKRPKVTILGVGLPTFGVLVFLFLYIPIFVVILFSFSSSETIGEWTDFSFRWYDKIFSDRQLASSLEVTLWISTLSMIISTILGTIVAMALERYEFFGKLTVDAILYLPVIIPDIIMALSLLLFFSSVGIPLSRYTVLIAHVAFNISFVAVVIRARLAGMDPKLEEASSDLYANPWQTFRRVTFPLLMPGILSGALLAFTLSFDEFVITSFLSGQGDKTLPVRIYDRLSKVGIKPDVNAIASLILLASALLVVASLLAQGNSQKTTS